MTYDEHLEIAASLPAYVGSCKTCGTEEGYPGEFGEDGEKECNQCKQIREEDECA